MIGKLLSASDENADFQIYTYRDVEPGSYATGRALSPTKICAPRCADIDAGEANSVRILRAFGVGIMRALESGEVERNHTRRCRTVVSSFRRWLCITRSDGQSSHSAGRPRYGLCQPGKTSKQPSAKAEADRRSA